MDDKLSRMSNDELWHLFPIILKPYNPDYHLWYLDERKKILDIVGKGSVLRINHFGSSAIHGLLGKPTVDILVEVRSDDKIEEIAYNFSKLKDYRCLKQKDRFNNLALLCLKGYSEVGFLEKVFHIHIRRINNHRELYFRDYLRENKLVADAYGNLKIKLLKKYRYNRDQYTKNKSDFIDRYTEIAQKQYPGRYN